MAVQKKKAAQPAATQQQRGAPPVRLSSSPLANINPKVKLHATTLLEVDSRRVGHARGRCYAPESGCPRSLPKAANLPNLPETVYGRSCLKW